MTNPMPQFTTFLFIVSGLFYTALSTTVGPPSVAPSPSNAPPPPPPAPPKEKQMTESKERRIYRKVEEGELAGHKLNKIRINFEPYNSRKDQVKGELKETQLLFKGVGQDVLKLKNLDTVVEKMKSIIALDLDKRKKKQPKEVLSSEEKKVDPTSQVLGRERYKTFVLSFRRLSATLGLEKTNPEITTKLDRDNLLYILTDPNVNPEIVQMLSDMAPKSEELALARKIDPGSYSNIGLYAEVLLNWSRQVKDRKEVHEVTEAAKNMWEPVWAAKHFYYKDGQDREHGILTDFLNWLRTLFEKKTRESLKALMEATLDMVNTYNANFANDLDFKPMMAIKPAAFDKGIKIPGVELSIASLLVHTTDFSNEVISDKDLIELLKLTRVLVNIPDETLMKEKDAIPGRLSMIKDSLPVLREEFEQIQFKDEATRNVVKENIEKFEEMLMKMVKDIEVAMKEYVEMRDNAMTLFNATEDMKFGKVFEHFAEFLSALVEAKKAKLKEDSDRIKYEKKAGGGGKETKEKTSSIATIEAPATKTDKVQQVADAPKAGQLEAKPDVKVEETSKAIEGAKSKQEEKREAGPRLAEDTGEMAQSVQAEVPKVQSPQSKGWWGAWDAVKGYMQYGWNALKETDQDQASYNAYITSNIT